MADPARTLTERFSAAIEDAFGPEHAGTDPVVRRSGQPQFGDFQVNAAMALAKRLGGQNPRHVAQTIVEHVRLDDVAEHVEIAGPGFVNVTLREQFIADAVGEQAVDPRLGVRPAPEPDVVVVDYSSPNLAKEMHVGHLRSTIIGDAIVRLLELRGHDVRRQNHFGDWGTQFGMLVEHLAELGTDVDAATLADLDAFYKKANERFRAFPEFAERARRRVVLLQQGDHETVSYWQTLLDESIAHVRAVYERLGVRLTDDDIRPESSFGAELVALEEELRQKDLLRVDEGALCAFPEGFTARDGTPLPLIFRKSDTAYLYASTDLAALKHRLDVLGGTHLVYVVGAPQAQHLAMVFAVAEQAGWLDPDGKRRATHASFGSVLGADGKMFRTRSGENVKLTALLDEAVERAEAAVAEKNPDLDAASRTAVARMVGIGAVKYADLVNDRIKDYVFDWDRMLSFDGNTAPYLQYAHARIRSIFRRGEMAADDTPAAPSSFVVRAPEERRLALQLLAFDEAVATAAESLQPHRLCGYLFDVASTFTDFYERCPVLRAPSEDERSSRLALCDLTARVLRTGLATLGIDAPDQM